MSKETESRYRLTKDIFDHILRVTEHEDQKAGRIIVSIAFLSATSATIYGIFTNNDMNYVFNNINLIPLCFILIIACSVLGAILMLFGLGPNIDDVEPNLLEGIDYVPKSIFYFKRISIENINNWQNYFLNSDIEDILNKGILDYTKESHIVSYRICYKIKYISCSKYFFMASIALTFFMTLLGIAN